MTDLSLTEDFDLQPHHTFGLPSRARWGGFLHRPEHIAEALGFAQARGLPFFLLGGGSNVVPFPFVDGVVGVLRLSGRSLARGADGVMRLTAAAGESWPELVAWTVGQGIGGLENLSGIPGTVGAAPVQNIGAYGTEIAELVESVTVLDLTDLSQQVIAGADCAFRYRQSRFKDEPGRYAILSVTLALPTDWAPNLGYRGLDTLPETATPAEVADAVLAIRGSKLPDWRVLGNAGSFFHNPVVSADHPAAQIEGAPRYPAPDGVKLSAGWLLEQAGMKGHRLGGAGFHAGHALVMVNHGTATCEDVAALTAEAQAAVQAKFGVALVREPLTLG
ncbi:UDP-N-acetylmuramate dehydrogenase [Cereibacter sphaeroides]|nr:UDP-N-acetylmuramate dehydrogenase [Cereibacter sphaeroides]